MRWLAREPLDIRISFTSAVCEPPSFSPGFVDDGYWVGATRVRTSEADLASLWGRDMLVTWAALDIQTRVGVGRKSAPRLLSLSFRDAVGARGGVWVRFERALRASKRADTRSSRTTRSELASTRFAARASARHRDGISQTTPRFTEMTLVSGTTLRNMTK